MLKGNLELLDILKELLNVHSDIDLAEQIEIPIDTLKGWRRKGEIPTRGHSLAYINLYIKMLREKQELKSKVFSLFEES